jgi:hypothetical protein
MSLSYSEEMESKDYDKNISKQIDSLKSYYGSYRIYQQKLSQSSTDLLDVTFLTKIRNIKMSLKVLLTYSIAERKRRIYSMNLRRRRGRMILMKPLRIKSKSSRF